ncbi:MAG: hypothetical protein AAGN46_16190 [Acidobacteriota bacterium]
MPQIQGALLRIARRRRLAAAERDDFVSFALEKIVEREDRIFSDAREIDDLQAFLYTVAERLFLDFNDHRWGRWRPLARSRRMGTTAVRLDRLIRRDGLEVGEAMARLPRAPRTPTRSLRRWAGELLAKRRPRAVAWERLELAAPVQRSPLVDEERRALRDRLLPEIQQSFGRLSLEERTLLRRKFFDGESGREIAEDLGLTTAVVFRRVYATLRKLSTDLEARGVDRSAVRRLTDSDGVAVIPRGAFAEALDGAERRNGST